MSSKTKDSDLGIEFASPEKAFWLEIKENTEKDVKSLEKLLKFQQSVLEMASNKLKDLD